jgi:hypothetical protein
MKPFDLEKAKRGEPITDKDGREPESLRLADDLDRCWVDPGLQLDAAAELCRLHEVNQKLLEALEGIADWTDKYTTAGHPISTIARAAIAKAKGDEK